MSKVISFSISDRYLDKLRSLYPALTDNLAAKQFITDGLESSLGSSLDGSLDDGLDGRVKSIIETSLDGILEGRLDAVAGKLISDLSERLSRLEKRLDTNLDGRLDDMERLLKLQRESSIASPLPPIGEPSPLPPSPDEPVRPAIEDSEKKIIPLPDTLIVSPIETVESGSEDEPDAIETVGMAAKDAAKYLKTKKVVVSHASLHRWIDREKIPNTSPQGRDALKHLILRGKLYFPKADQP